MRYLLAALSIALLSPSGAVQAQEQMQVPQSPAEISLGFVPVVKSAAPAVVNIYARRVVEARTSPFMDDPFFGRMFRDFGQSRPRVQNSLGSGVILSPDGIVVSNHHVVGGSTDIRVVLNDRREYSAHVLLADEDSDLAVLQLDGAEDLPALELRPSDTVEVGELVLAIGNPFGVGQTVSSGIVSGLARSGLATGNGRGLFIQTDAPINPGNSGGALVDVAGRLIGINTSILSRSGGSNGIGFAIPSDMVAQFVAQAQAGEERFERPWMGATGQPVSQDMSEALGLDGPYGVALTELHPSSPLAEVGYGVGDVILTVDGTPVFTPEEILYHLAVAGAGANVVIEGMVDGEMSREEITLVHAPDVPPRAPLTTSEETVLPGMALSTINPAVQAEFGLPMFIEGVIIEDPGPLGARLGVRAGDILRAVNDMAVTTGAEAEEALAGATRRLSLDILRGGRRVVLRFRL
ncbi:trypsin-like peptidase domain-containing protein [Roseovarius sp. C7]|uniref:trypsin-like peptidase domain-containing protein n=1 Tax=Roseovarius sp. C7 TaxID=3398643 RepID=UPI0039F6C168